MTRVITRYFDSSEKAMSFRRDLLIRQSVPTDIVSVYDEAAGLADKLIAADVDAGAAQTYQDKVAAGGVVVMVRAGSTPLMVAKITRETAIQEGAILLDGVTEEVVVKDGPIKAPSIIPGGPLMMTKRLDLPTTNYHMANWPIPLISRRKPADLSMSLFPVHGRMAEFAYPLISRAKPFTGSIIDRHQRMASWPIGLLVPGHKYMAKFPFAHIVPGHKFMAGFPIKHLVPGHKFMANWPIKHLVPGRGSMANWPFPHLINGKQGTNSLVPGHKYMAKFPFAHIVPGHKFMASFPIKHLIPGHKFMAKFPFGHIVPGHRYMAKFPFAHIVPGHKFMAGWPIKHLVPGHKRMAAFPIPLIIRR